MQKMRIKFSEIPLALCREQPGVCGGGAGRGAASWDGVSEYCEIMTGTRGLHICDITSHHPDITKQHPLTNHTQSIWIESTSIYNHFGHFRLRVTFRTLCQAETGNCPSVPSVWVAVWPQCCAQCHHLTRTQIRETWVAWDLGLSLAGVRADFPQNIENNIIY